MNCCCESSVRWVPSRLSRSAATEPKSYLQERCLADLRALSWFSGCLHGSESRGAFATGCQTRRLVKRIAGQDEDGRPGAGNRGSAGELLLVAVTRAQAEPQRRARPHIILSYSLGHCQVGACTFTSWLQADGGGDTAYGRPSSHTRLFGLQQCWCTRS